MSSENKSGASTQPVESLSPNSPTDTDAASKQSAALLQARIELLEAHVNNLIERVRVLEEGHDWTWIGKCHDCAAEWHDPDQAVVNDWCEGHALTAHEKGSRMFHHPYVVPVVKR